MTQLDLTPAPTLPDDQPVRGVSVLDARGARIKAMTAFGVMTIPLAGTLAAAWLAWAGYATRVDAWLFVAMYVLHMAGVSIGYHRFLAHRAFKTSPLFRALILICGSMAAQGPILFWVTTHRRHHAYSDRPGDPHSPNLLGESRAERLRGLWHAHMPWMMSPEMSSWSYFAQDILKDRSLLFFNRTYFYWVLLGLAIPAVAGGLITASWMGALCGLMFGGFARMFIANQFAWCVGSICHRYGSRPFDTRDHSTNNWIVAFLTFGEGLQNNHHAFPAWYRHGVHWWEPDLSGWMLALFGRLGIVEELRSPSRDVIERVRKREPGGA
ncbi:acyl-CoA desaturase [Burkholderia gladioli]|uniref:acyl-CoA desaturase n=1 Tax=Burkholderia gladioli TaxID=28095 RepID=UPI00062719B4|nr:acyl-CoA desaturase [Burkholderia gladioli]KKJ05267.1 fatty acid desaturase [Burkholderia gladioli]